MHHADTVCVMISSALTLRLLLLGSLCLATIAPLAVAQSVTTWRNDIGRTGQNLAETTLTPANVNAATFGKLWSYPVDGYVYAQPLYLPGVNIAGAAHNVVIIATEHDSVFAFDADHNLQLWQASLVDTAHGASPGASSDTGTSDLPPELGITATPVIDPATGTIYIEARSLENGTTVHRLHALDLTTGAERPNSPVVIAGSVPGNGSGSVNGVIAFQPQWQHSRPGMLLLNGKVYMAFASLGDAGPYHGWVFGYDSTSLQQTGIYNTTPNGTEGGIWASGAGLAADTLGKGGRMFVVSGNGDPNDGPPYSDTQNFGNAVENLDLSNGIHVVDQWTPYDTATLSYWDTDQGSGGVLLLPDQPGPHPHELVQVGKDGRIEVLDRDNLGGFDPSSNRIVQELPNILQGLWSTPAYWNNNVYFWGVNDTLHQFSLQNGLLNPTPVAQSALVADYPGASPAISSNGTDAGILWSILSGPNGTASPAILCAFDATDVSKLLYTSGQNTVRDTPGNAVKFTVPTIANGKVFVGTLGEVDVYGLLSTAPAIVPPVTFSPTPGYFTEGQTVALSVAQPNATIFYTTNGTPATSASTPYMGPFTVDSQVTVQAFASAPGLLDGAPVTGTYVVGRVPAISYVNGFANVSSLAFNGSAVNAFDHTLQLTSDGQWQSGSVFTTTSLDIRSFATDFTFQVTGPLPLSEGFTFAIQSSSPQAVAWAGDNLGYGSPWWRPEPGIHNSVAVKFDLTNDVGEGANTTGLFLNGAEPLFPSLSLTGSGVNLSSGHVLAAHLAYDGTTLTLTLTDPVAHATYTTSFPVDIPAAVGGNSAYVGFTGSTGLAAANQKILSWTFSSHQDLGPQAPVALPSFSLAPGVYTVPQTLTISDTQPGANLFYATATPGTPLTAFAHLPGDLTLDHTITVQSLARSAGYPDSGITTATFLFPVGTPPAFLPAEQNLLGSAGTGTLQPVTADFNGDGHPDFAILSTGAASIALLLNDGHGGLLPPVTYLLGRSPVSLVTADFNGDGHPDLAVLSSAGTLTVLLNDGAGAFPTARSTTYVVPVGAIHLALGDFNADGRPDFVLTNRTKGTVSIMLSTASGTLQPALTLSVGRAPMGSAVADLNDDGFLDFITWNSGDNTVAILLNDTNGGFLPPATYHTGNDPYSLAIADLNHDGFLDVAVTNLTDSTLTVLLNDTTGKLLPQVTYPTGHLPSTLLATDMNADGIPDLVVGNLSDHTAGILLGKGDGSFLPENTLPLAASPGSVLAADFNGDGRPDLAFTTFAPESSNRNMARPSGRTTGPASPPSGGGLTLLIQAPAAPHP